MASVHLSEARSPISRSRLSISSLQVAASLMPTSSSRSRSGTISRSIPCMSDSTLALSARSAPAGGANRRHCGDASASRSRTSSARPSSATGRRSSSVARSCCSSRTSSSISSDCSSSRILHRAAQSAARALKRCSTRSTSRRHSEVDRGRSARSSNAAARSLDRLVTDASAARRNGAGVSAAASPADRSRARRCSDQSSSPSDGDGGSNAGDEEEEEQQPGGDGAEVSTVLGLAMAIENEELELTGP
ncbi:hypothetical protein PVAP13_9KG272552 [Panicum virgatum]|uniref:Uncharacterized protein n=1 Tax=Panicum virgatum TaxID=38727 RepID=A0A8T0NRN3_PANVG|nr:hypothetical protein PVAP13_9KG272552 [Panicum virgatum]